MFMDQLFQHIAKQTMDSKNIHKYFLVLNRYSLALVGSKRKNTSAKNKREMILKFQNWSMKRYITNYFTNYKSK
jgi:hypothetical protein